MPTSKDGREDSEATRKGVGGAEMTTLFSTEPLGSDEAVSGWGSLSSLEAGTLASRLDVSQSAVKTRFPALPEVVAQPFPGRLVLEDSKWVAAAAAPRGGVSLEETLGV